MTTRKIGRWCGRWALACAALCTSGTVAGASELELPTLIKASRVVTAPGQVIENGAVLIENGVISAVGANLSAPAGADVYEFDNLTIYPALIESYHERDLPSPEGEEEDASPDLGHENDLIQPERDASSAPVTDDVLKQLRNAGFALAVGYPEDGVFRGSAVIHTTGEGSLRDNLLRSGVAMGVGLETGQGGYPSSLMGSVALMRQTVADARWYADAKARYARNSAQRAPDYDESLEALGAVVAGEQAVVFETENSQAALRALALMKELGLEGALLGNGEEYQRLEEIVAADVALMLPLDFPSAPSVTGPIEDAVEKLEPSLAELRHWKAAPDNPARLITAGARVALTSHALGSPAEFYGKVAVAVEHGLTQEQALAATTTVPAAFYGLDDIAGTIAPGKMANLILAEGDLFVEKPKIQEVWVDGRRYEFEEIKPPEVNPVGQWTVNVDAGGQQMEADFSVSGSVESPTGSFSMMGQQIPVKDITVSGKTAIVTLDAAAVGAPGEITLRMNIDGDSATGSGDSPMGTFSFTARRTSSTPDEGGMVQ